jgi:hypothetical protein
MIVVVNVLAQSILQLLDAGELVQVEEFGL